MNYGKLFIAGEWIEASKTSLVVDKYNGKAIAPFGIASEMQVNSAVSAARLAFENSSLPPYARYEILVRAEGMAVSMTKCNT
ncbi:hypothetical protein BC443_16750 [Salinicola sp. MIT1003]|nr:hypothetical protein BC443_16750 [Salinicola sp. MIT1003]